VVAPKGHAGERSARVMAKSSATGGANHMEVRFDRCESRLDELIDLILGALCVGVGPSLVAA
jgi:hypothetical protein